jgi:hypothetical protein
MSLQYIGQQITIYVGLFLVVGGVIGNGINVLVFSTVRNYRTTPCSFYFLVASLFNILYIMINLSSRVASAGFGIDLTRTSDSWCKIRTFCLFTLALITISCSCLATIDQFFVTSQSAYLRRLSNIKWTYRITLIMIIVWCLHGIPPLLVYSISSISNTCVNTNAVYAIYSLFYLLGLVSAIPVVIMVIFGYLTYRNIHLTRVLAEQHADRQLAKMTLIQVVLVVICIVPYGIINTYNVITTRMTKDANRLLSEGFALTILSLVTYFYYAVCVFYFC